jgi:hypothetical protein
MAGSEFASVESLGRTLGGHDVFLLTLGVGKTDEKPALLVVGNVHAPHLLGSELALRLAQRAVEEAESSPEVRKLLDRVTIYVIPRPTPDASECFFQKPYAERSVNHRSMDDDGDGSIDEDGPNDLNGDGLITMMRVANTAGKYILHPDDERILIEADREKNEHGRFTLYVEGRDDDRDEQLNEDPPGGVDLNRNFTFRYPYFGFGAGPHQVSEVESRAVADFAFQHPNIAAVLTFTPEDNLMELWKTDPGQEEDRIKTTLLSEDEPYIKHLAETYREILAREEAPESPEGAGSFSQWAYFHYGRWSLACRGWWIPQVDAEDADKEDKNEQDTEGENEDNSQADTEAEATDEESEGDDEPDERGSDQIGALAWFAKQGIDGFVAWKRIDHPDFPDQEVEVGGFRPFVRLNPPAEQLDGLTESHWQFVRALVDAFPRLAIAELKAESLGANVWRVTVAVVNEGRLPTMSEMGRINRRPHPVQVEIIMPRGVELVTGHPRSQVPPLGAEGGRTERTWLVLAPSEKTIAVQVRAWSPSVGSVSRSVELAL